MAGGRFGARALLVAGVLVLGLSSLAGAWATGGAMLLALRVVEGFSFATVVSAAPKIVLDASSRGDRDSRLGIWSGYMPGGMALAMVVAPFVTEALGWRSLWWLSAGAALLTMALALAGTGGATGPSSRSATPMPASTGPAQARRCRSAPCGSMAGRSCSSPSSGSRSQPGSRHS